MFREFKAHPLSFILLFAGLILSLLFYVYFAHDPHFERFVVLGLSGIYFLWSLVHHHQKGDLSTSIVIEYLLIALLAVVFLLSTTV